MTATLNAVAKQQFIFHEASKGPSYIGDVLSYNDSASLGLSREINQENICSLHVYSHILKDPSRIITHFIFGINDSKKTNEKLVNYHKYLVDNQHKCGVVKLNKVDKGIITPLGEEGCSKIGLRIGFLCRILPHSDDRNVPTKSDLLVSTSSSIDPINDRRNNNQINRKDEFEYMSHQYTFPTSLPSTTEAVASVNNSDRNAAGEGEPVDLAIPLSSSLSSFTATQKDRANKQVVRFSYEVGESSESRTVRTETEESQVEKERKDEITMEVNPYNSVKRFRATRHQSIILHLRNLNNFVKSELIDVVASSVAASVAAGSGTGIGPNSVGLLSVLDLACGKGGDIGKWLRVKAGLRRYVGSDIALESLRDFQTLRLDYESAKKLDKLVHADLGCMSLTKDRVNTFSWLDKDHKEGDWAVTVPLTEADKFDLISCQFAMHYMFKSSERANHFFGEISQLLAERGRYIATTVDSGVLALYVMKVLYGLPLGYEQNRYRERDELDCVVGEVSPDGTFLTLRIQNEFQDCFLVIKMSISNANRLLALNSLSSRDRNSQQGDDQSLGIEYEFQLEDAVNSPEWVVPLGPSLDHLLARNSLQLESLQNFHEFIHDRLSIPASAQLFRDMRVPTVTGSMSAAEWALARLYLVLTVKRVFEPNSPLAPMPAELSSDHIHRWRAPASPLCSPPRFEPSSPVNPPRPSALGGDEAGTRWVPHTPVDELTMMSDIGNSGGNSPVLNLGTGHGIDGGFRYGYGYEEEQQPEGEEDEEELDEATLFTIRKKELAMQLAGGEEAWDLLDQDQAEIFLERAMHIMNDKPGDEDKGVTE